MKAFQVNGWYAKTSIYCCVYFLTVAGIFFLLGTEMRWERLTVSKRKPQQWHSSADLSTLGCNLVSTVVLAHTVKLQSDIFSLTWGLAQHHHSLFYPIINPTYTFSIVENDIWKDVVSTYRESDGTRVRETPSSWHKGTSVASATLCNLWTFSWGLFLTHYDCCCGKLPDQLWLRAAAPQESHLASSNGETEAVMKEHQWPFKII